MMDRDGTSALDGAKWGSATVMIPQGFASGVGADADPPEVGDVVLGEVERIGAHTKIEGREGQRITIYAGDRMVGVLGHRYAPDQFEGYAEIAGGHVDLLSVAGVVGIVRSRHGDMGRPTRLRVLGYVRDLDGQRLSTRRFAIEPGPVEAERPIGIAVVGTMMDAGKTTAATAIVRGAVARGLVVGAAKITGTAAGKDIAHMRDAGARRAVDFTACGWPSTYLCGSAELEETARTLYDALLRVRPDVVVMELADGITQRETAMLLRSPVFASLVDAVVFASGDALGAEAGVARLRSLGLAVVATSGRASMSPLLVAETEAVTGLPCLTRQALESGVVFDLVSRPVLAT